MQEEYLSDLPLFDSMRPLIPPPAGTRPSIPPPPRLPSIKMNPLRIPRVVGISLELLMKGVEYDAIILSLTESLLNEKSLSNPTCRELMLRNLKRSIPKQSATWERVVGFCQGKVALEDLRVALMAALRADTLSSDALRQAFAHHTGVDQEVLAWWSEIARLNPIRLIALSAHAPDTSLLGTLFERIISQIVTEQNPRNLLKELQGVGPVNAIPELDEILVISPTTSLISCCVGFGSQALHCPGSSRSQWNTVFEKLSTQLTCPA